MLKVGACCGDLKKYAKTDEEWFDFIKECGFDSVDFCFNGAPDDDSSILKKSDEELKDYCLKIKALGEKNELVFGQAHAPGFLPWDVAPECFFEEKYLKLFINSIKGASLIGAPYLVIHPIMFKDPENNFFKSIDYNVKFYNLLKPYAEKHNVIIAIENMCAINPLRKQGVPSNSSSTEKINFLLDKLGDDQRFCACLDTGHSFFCGQEPAQFARDLCSRLKVIHLQDGDGVQDLHLPPTYGYADWNELLTALKEIGFRGILNMEVSFMGALNCKCSYKPTTVEPLIAMGKYQCALARDFAKFIEE